MSTCSGQSFNSEDSKAQQRQMWDNAAPGWHASWPSFERGAQKVSDKIMELADIKPGDKVLDIATGIEEPAVTTARKVMPDGKVIATDISPKMLAIAEIRAKSLGLDAIIKFRESDGVKLLDVLEPRAIFDAILSRWGLMFLPNLDSTLGRIRQILATDGSLSVAVWSAPSKVPLLDLVFATVRKQIDAPPQPPKTPGSFALADAEALKKSFIQGGFKDIRIDMLQITFDFDSPESYIRFH
jgi:ubiquinone/menaquinone biosynthesis C-methylase UbiE